MNDAELYRPLRCMEPHCTKRCKLPRVGRPAAFCSSACRNRHHRRRIELLEALASLEAALAAASKSERAALMHRRKALRFQLFRYPEIPTTVA